MRSLVVAGHLVALLFLPFLLVGIINRTKARWAGRRGPRLFQSLSDAVRLLRKNAIYSRVATQVFRLGSLIVLVTTIFAGLVVPIVSATPPLSFAYDFVVIAYVLGLGRVFLILSALDTGSAFEGMGASREATYAVFAEPALFIGFGALVIAGGGDSLAALLGGVGGDGGRPELVAIRLLLATALLILLQVEAARLPVDDPATHLELTMIHEVMVLDHSGPELAFIQWSAGAKLVVYGSMVVGLLLPDLGAWHPALTALARIAALSAVAIIIGLCESLMARFKLRTVPAYIMAALFVSGLALALSASLAGGLQ
jgi:formate hydrogenlyase subunit 4